MRRLIGSALLILIGLGSASAEPAGRRVKLAATLYGETVGEVQLTLAEHATNQLTYRSDLRVVRNRLRLRNQALIEVSFDPASGNLIHSKARRCTTPEDGSAPPSCGPLRELSRVAAVPALAAEIMLAHHVDDAQHCLPVVDEESGTQGLACATARLTEQGIELTGSKLDEPFRAVVADDMLVRLELPRQGAEFAKITGTVQLSNADLFAEPIPVSGDAAGAILRGALKLRIFGIPQALASLKKVSAPGQTATLAQDGASLRVEVSPVALPKTKRSREILDHAAFLLAHARGGHVDCQAATAWFLGQARARGWRARPAEGLAFVDGRFAFHQWAILETPDGAVPVDPLLAQVPADAGHVQFADVGESAGPLLISFQRSLSLAVE